jgi:hypothetical protein
VPSRAILSFITNFIQELFKEVGAPSLPSHTTSTNVMTSTKLQVPMQATKSPLDYAHLSSALRLTQDRAHVARAAPSSVSVSDENSSDDGEFDTLRDKGNDVTEDFDVFFQYDARASDVSSKRSDSSMSHSSGDSDFDMSPVHNVRRVK